jgi:hypothetical protein
MIRLFRLLVVVAGYYYLLLVSITWSWYNLLVTFTIMVMEEQKKLHHFACTVVMALLAQNAMNSWS